MSFFPEYIKILDRNDVKASLRMDTTGDFHSESGTCETLSVTATVARTGENQLWVGMRFLASASAFFSKVSLVTDSRLADNART